MAHRTEISTLGEFGLIERLQAQVKLQQPTTQKGIGDDAAVIAPRAGQQFVVSTDMLVEQIHFDLSFHPLRHLGYKAAVVNFSDIAAMNALPEQLTLSLAISNRFSLEAVEELFAGVLLACERYHVDLVGGDTTSSPRGLILSLTAIGQAPPEQIVYRNGAKVGDLLCVTGDLGGAYMGLQLLNREKQVFLQNPNEQPDLSGHDYVLGRYLKPEARTDIVRHFLDQGVRPTAMLDISDGLSSETLHLCQQSGVGVMLYEKNIPVDFRTEQSLEPFPFGAMTAALHGGDEYELLFTIDPADHAKLEHHPDIHFIGHCLPAEEGCHLTMRSEQVVKLQAQGWNHFQQNTNKEDDA
ncbi:MAG: thiamine-phosphate kinase [Bernardetiaceae bacterium]